MNSLAPKFSLRNISPGTKFEVVYLSVDDIEKRMIPNPPKPIMNFYWQFLRELASTSRWGFIDTNLNELCPLVKPMGIDEFLKTWWGSGSTSV